jgi:hypothetical protein
MQHAHAADAPEFEPMPEAGDAVTAQGVKATARPRAEALFEDVFLEPGVLLPRLPYHSVSSRALAAATHNVAGGSSSNATTAASAAAPVSARLGILYNRGVVASVDEKPAPLALALKQHGRAMDTRDHRAVKLLPMPPQRPPLFGANLKRGEMGGHNERMDHLTTDLAHEEALQRTKALIERGNRLCATTLAEFSATAHRLAKRGVIIAPPAQPGADVAAATAR